VQLQEVALLSALAARRAADEAAVPSDAVVDVDDEVARLQTLEEVARHDAAEGARTPDPDGAE
jgi:hypothetical protein